MKGRDRGAHWAGDKSNMITRLPRLTLGHSSVQRVRVSLRQAVHQACVPLTELDARLARRMPRGSAAWVVLRAVVVKGRPGRWSCDAWSEATRPGQLGLRGSLEARSAKQLAAAGLSFDEGKVPASAGFLGVCSCVWAGESRVVQRRFALRVLCSRRVYRLSTCTARANTARALSAVPDLGCRAR